MNSLSFASGPLCRFNLRVREIAYFVYGDTHRRIGAPRRRATHGRWKPQLRCLPFQHRGEAERDLLGVVLRDARQNHDVATTSAIWGGDAGTERARIVRISRR